MLRRVFRSRYLQCFSCGSTTGIKQDGLTRHFDCPDCGAPNYLDENGEQADPPVATDAQGPAPRYATRSKASSPPLQSEDASDVFCRQCQMNQHRRLAFQAGYYPEDASEEELKQLDQGLAAFRKNLDQRHPLVCDDCAKKVNNRLGQAGYTAKTDHLRRMMDRTRGTRAASHRRTLLDPINSLGYYLWYAAYVLQLLWHVKAVLKALARSDDGMYDPDDETWSSRAFRFANTAVEHLPQEDLLIWASIVATMSCFWWNPHFVQFVRGFTRHLVGLEQWYSFQGLIAFFRFGFRSVVQVQSEDESRNVSISVHLVLAIVMALMYRLALGSIKVDTRPLFAAREVTVTPDGPATQSSDPLSFAQEWSEVLQAPSNPSSVTSTSLPRSSIPLSRSGGLDSLYSSASDYGSPFASVATSRQSPFITQPLSAHTNADADAMDWTPTESPYPAFQKVPAPRPQPDPLDSPFRHRVPAAPKRDAQGFYPRQRPPPQAPLAAPPAAPPAPVEPIQERHSIFQTNGAMFPSRAQDDGSEVNFAQPKFFANAQGNEEVNFLADMLSSRLGHGSDASELDSVRLNNEVRPNNDLGPTNGVRNREEHTNGFRKPALQERHVQGARAQPKPSPSLIGPFLLGISLALWPVFSAVALPWVVYAQSAILAVAGVLAFRLMDDYTQAHMAGRQAPGSVAHAGPLFAMLELGALCSLGWMLWQGAAGVGVYGTMVLGLMLAHATWNSFYKAT